MTITDEMVEKAYDAWLNKEGVDTMRAALEAIAPMLIAQGMREAARIVLTLPPARASSTILDRAQELDPQADYDPTIQPYDEPFRHKEELEQPGDPTNPFQRRDLAAQIKRAQELDPK